MDKTQHTDVRSDRELLEETLQIVRTLKENTTPSSVAPQPALINHNERLKTLWLEFSEVKKYSIEQMNSDESKIMEFRSYGLSHGIATGPVALLRHFFARLLREKAV